MHGTFTKRVSRAGTKWIPREIELLKTGRKSCASVKELREKFLPFRSEVMIVHKLWILNLAYNHRYDPWTEDEKTTLRDMIEGGLLLPQIKTALPGRTGPSIERQKREMGLVRARTFKLRVPDQAPKPTMFAPPVKCHDSRYLRELASRRHLVDLKRAGHSPTQTELGPSHDGTPVRIWGRSADQSWVGSQGALCANS